MTSGWPSLNCFHASYRGRRSATADANIVVTLLSPPINRFHSIDPYTVNFMAWSLSLRPALPQVCQQIAKKPVALGEKSTLAFSSI